MLILVLVDNYLKRMVWAFFGFGIPAFRSIPKLRDATAIRARV